MSVHDMEVMMDQFDENAVDNVAVFRIDDDAMADWALRKISEEQKELDRLEQIANQQILEIQMKLQREKEAYDRKTSYLKKCLQGYFQTVPHKATKTQETYKLLSGSLVQKKSTSKMVVQDDDKLIAYFRQNDLGEYIKVKEEPKWGEFKKLLSIVDGNVIYTETGEIVDAVSVENVPEKFEIKL